MLHNTDTMDTAAFSYSSRRTSGFTIVELLIVIVVIAILAAIATVAYIGIQQKAKTSAVSSAVNSWQKVIAMEASTTNSLPIGPTSYCLGSSIADFPAADGFNSGTCYKLSTWMESDPTNVTTTETKYDPTFFTNWPSDIKRPNGVLPTTTDSFTLPSGNDVVHFDIRSRGAVVVKDRAPSGGTLIAALNVTVGPNQVYMLLSWVPQIQGQCLTGGSTNAYFVKAGAQTQGSLAGDYCVMLIQ